MVTNVSCNGGNNGSAAVAANNGSPSYTYLWSPSGGTGQTAINLTAGSYTVTVTDSHGCTITSTAVIAQPTVLAAAASMVADVSCNGGNNGSATVATNNGSPAYTYLWSPSGGTGQTASNLMAGTYTVTVTDSHGCTITSTAVIAQPTVLAAAASMLTNASCNGGNNGSATVVANNGSPAYTYLWAPSGGTGQTASNLTAGTYTVTVTDSHGCTITSTAVITQPTTLMAAASMVTDVSCNGGNDGSVAVAASNGSPAYTYLWSPSGGTGQTASILTAGTYTVTVTDANGCSTTSTAIIAQPTTLAAAASMVTDVSCNGGNNGSAAVAANNGSPAYTYLWSPSGGTGQTANNLIAGTYTVTVTDSHGCTISSTAVIAEPTVLAAAVFMVADVSCNGGNDGSAAVAANNGSPSYTYLWTPSGGTGQTANNLTAGNYTVTVTDSHGCTISSTTVIAEPTALAAAASMVTDVLCNGGNDGSATVAASNGSPAYTYLWSPSGGTGQTANNLIAGTYTVTVTDSHGCSLTSTAVITEPTVVTAIASTVNNVACFSGNDGTAAVNPGGGIPPYRYAWSPSGGNAITASNLVAGTYTVTVTDVNNCSITSIAVIAEPTVLTAFATTLNNIACSSANNGVAAVTPGGGAGTYTYLWSPSGGTGMTASNLGGNTYTVTVTDGNGCSQTSTTTITQSIPVSSNITSTTNVLCNGGNDGQAVVAAAGGSGAGTYTYLWLPSGGSNVTASNLSAGNYTVVVADANGCTVTSTTVINQPTPVTLSVNGAATICIGKATTIAAVPGGGTLPYTYLWNNGSTFASQAVAPLTTTIYTVVVTDANGCTISQSVTITVHPPLNVTANAPPQICNGGSGTVSASAGGGNGGPYTYTWNSGQTTSSFTASPAFTTVYTVTIDDGCSPPVQTTTSIIVNPVPVVSFTPLYAESCVPASVDFTSDSIAGLPGSGYLWNFGDGSTSTNINPTHVYTSAGQYSVTLTITSAQGCINTLTVTNLVTANAIPLADFTAPEQVGINEAVDISFINSSAGSSAWQWDFGDNSGTASVFNPTHTYTDTGVYTIQLIAMSPAGCLDTTYRSIDVIGEFAIFIPNTFTPNGDGVNDMFNAFGVYVRDFDMVILDRWGAKIFHSNSLTNGWDGTYFENGTICQNGVYVYKIMAHDAFGKLHEFVGRVSLVR
jgi:gliding motility-associated-like protein